MTEQGHKWLEGTVMRPVLVLGCMMLQLVCLMLLRLEWER